MLPNRAVNASSVTGMVGVGTWNTQAEFADVKVVRGDTTLYQSDFSNGMAEWKVVSGAWKTTSDGTLRQTGGGTPALALVGDPAWIDYTLTLKARKTGGTEGFLLTFGSPGDGTKTWWNVGGWGNTRHAVEAPGFWTPDVRGSVQTGRWYDLRVEVQGTDLRCYLDGRLIHDTARVLNAGERTRRFRELQSSAGFPLLNPWERQVLNDLAGRQVYVGAAARATFWTVPGSARFDGLSPVEQAAILRKVIRNRMTWNTGWGFGGDPGRDAAIIASMDGAVILHNRLGLFDKHLTANNSPGTPTADAGYEGSIRFGGANNYYTAIHEISHALGTGTYGRWGELMVDGRWTGLYANDRLSRFDGPGAVLNGDAAHYWPYGLNNDGQESDLIAERHVQLVHAMRRDMGVATQDVTGSTAVADGIYTLAPRHVPGSALDVPKADAGAPVDIRASTGGDGQRFLLDLQGDRTYRLRTALPGNRAVELPNGATADGTKLRLWDDNGNPAQRWYLIPTGDGWYRIAPRNDVYKGMDVDGIATADGTRVQSWGYWDGLNQQWKLTRVADLPPDGTPGDVNGDGRVDVSDAVLALKFLAGLELPTSEQERAADMDASGAVDVSDVVLILQRAVQIDTGG